MKIRKLLSCLLFTAVLFSQKANGGTCGDLILTTQAEVDAFPLMGCDSIIGSLEINGPGIYRLDSLYKLKYVSLHLDLEGLQITNFNGLNNLFRVGQNFSIISCQQLTSLSGVEEIDSVEYYIVTQCHSLIEINKAPPVVIRDYHFAFNESLLQISLYPSSQYLNAINILHNPLLRTIIGFQSLSESSVTVSYNDSLRTVDAFQNIKVFETISFEYNHSLQKIDFLDNATHGLSSNGGVRIAACNHLNEINLPSLKTTGRFSISDNPQLDVCCFVTDFLNNGGSYDHIDIVNNGENCESLSDVLNFCSAADGDGDYIPGITDNCPDFPNPDQQDWDNDGVGNPCDNCAVVYNPDQVDSNNNFIGDVCEYDINRIGINTINPKAALQLENGDLYIREPARGIILRDHLGVCYRIFVDEYGNMRKTAISCP